ncbi:hypothetical protein N431DRAFT_547244 [Stipitochalara longipes BDJ]|nr:hypothetical protein N431DRAFT_547244 [Stipitochalara longipes BDJ]
MATNLRPTTRPFAPRSPRPCLYFQEGSCMFGSRCKYLHDVTVKPGQPHEQTHEQHNERYDQGITAEEEEELARELEKLAVSKQERNDSTTFVRRIYGSLVTFGVGAMVTAIKLPTNFEFGKWVQNDVVVCTWFRPARMAYLTFADPAAMNEAAEMLLKTPTPSGRIHSCKFHQPQHNDRLNRFSLEVRNLDLDCGEDWFKDILATNYPLKVKLKEPVSDTPPDEARGLVEGLLQSIGPVKNCVLSNDPKRITLALSASFDDENNVAKAVKDLNGTEHKDVGPLRLRRVVSVKFNIPTKIFTALLVDLQKLQKQSQLEHRVRLSLPLTNDTNKPSQCLRIAANGGDAPKSVAKVKVELEKLLGGTIITIEDAPLWHSFFGTLPGLMYLTSLSHANRLYIHVDVRKSQLLFYGGTPSRRGDAQRVLLAKVADLNEGHQIWVLSPKEFGAALTGSFARLQEVYKDKVAFNIASNPKEILLRGSRKDLQIAKTVFHGEEFWYEGDDASPPSPPTASPDDCCLCMTEPESDDVMTTSCNHIYCRGCFLHQVKSVSEDEIPLRCHARDEEGRCPHVFSLEQLRVILDFTTFEALLETSFKIYIRSHPTEFQYCPTPDCQSIYGVPPAASQEVPVIGPAHPEASNFFCIACLSAICTKCKAVFHEGMTCAEYQDSLNSEANQEFMRENGIKECPHCQTPIQKNGGCNHVQCLGCNVHVCWNCLATFQESGPCYKHLTDVHGGNGLDEDYLFGELTDDED